MGQVIDFSEPRKQLMLTVKLGPSEDDIYAMPYASGMKIGEARRFASIYNGYSEAQSFEQQMAVLEQMIDIFSHYIPKDKIDDLTFDEAATIFDAWIDGNEKTGVTMGELRTSSAL